MIAEAERRQVRHLKVRFHDGGVLLEPCEDIGCTVAPDGRAGCGRFACPTCGDGIPPNSHGGANGGVVDCRCGTHLALSR